MKKNIYQTLLSVTFLFRIMVPIGNAAYLMCLISTGKDSVWVAVYVAAILLEVAVMMAVGAGLQSPAARRLGAYGAFALATIHFVAFMALYVFHPACRQVLTPLYMILLTVGSIWMMGIANGSLISVAGMPDLAKDSSSQEENPEIA
ncbi:MAG: hypothetical protein IKM33_01535 [Clostridia bacterium]|nr:hypothetical protein [Clostridia bacterium]